MSSLKKITRGILITTNRPPCNTFDELYPDMAKKPEVVNEGDSRFVQIGHSIGNLVTEKNKAYGNSAGKSIGYLMLLYPDGIKPHQYSDMLLLVRDFDKSMRIATDPDAFGENPWMDKAGYAILGVAKTDNGPVPTSKEMSEDEKEDALFGWNRDD